MLTSLAAIVEIPTAGLRSELDALYSIEARELETIAAEMGLKHSSSILILYVSLRITSIKTTDYWITYWQDSEIS